MQKARRLTIILQAMATLPPIIFALVYIRVVSIETTLSLVGVGVIAALFGYNLYRFSQSKRLIYYPLLPVLVLSFLIYGIYQLGSKDTPQSFEAMNFPQHKAALFTLPKVSYIDKVCYYSGIDKNAKFKLHYAQNGKWKTFYEHKERFPYSFTWKCFDAKVSTHQLYFDLISAKIQLGEVRLFDKNQNPIAYKSNLKLLNDEPHALFDQSYYSGTVFDEIYHPRTAYEILHELPVYENTHPYLGKIIIGWGIKAFGMNPFGWRIMNLLFASLLIIVIYYFANALFAKRTFAFFGALLMTYSFMHLTQGRIGLIDTFGVLFILTSYYLLYIFISKQKLRWLMLSGVFFGLASAIKWSAVFASLGFVAIALYLLFTRYPLQKRFGGLKLLLYGIASYGVLAVGVYALSFYEIYLQTGSLDKIIEYQVNMFNYHSAVKGSHPYASAWWSWIIDYRPMCYKREDTPAFFSSITAFGNPAIFWMGLVSIIYLYTKRCQHTLNSTFIFFAFIALFLPYAFIGREMFIYHFYYAIPFLMLAILYFLRDMIKRFDLVRRYFLLYFTLVWGLFLLYYPVLTGYRVSKEYVDNVLRWFPGWWF
ncbi:MAG: glycosyltransferase family 39 protein [Campylobacterota bacterium]|nr:glycosyltransferase family 39 protein [Campylobacterota bacterium]